MKVIDETENDLRKLISADFGHLGDRNFRAALIDWLHFKARSIPPLQRKVLVSEEVLSHLGQYPAISKIRLLLETTGDLSPWLSNFIRKKKASPTSDMMFNDWQIVHFHLGGIFKSPSEITRTSNLLFAHIAATEATLIDVAAHKSWTRIALLKTLLRTNPNLPYQVNKVTGHRLTDEQYKKFRDKHTNVILDIDGKMILPGMGIMSSGHALRITNYEMWFSRQVDHFKYVFANDNVPAELKTAIYSMLGVPVRLGAWYDARGLAIIDKNRSGLVLHQMKPFE